MKKIANALNNRTIIAIDPATHSLAFSIFSAEEGTNYLRACGKLHMKGCSTSEQFERINVFVPFIIEQYAPSLLAIEQPIYIQNFQTSRSLSYIVGYTWGRFAQEGIKVIDIGPMQWKSALGYKKVSAEEKKIWATSMTPTEVKKKTDFERKNRIKFIIENKMNISSIQDNDIIDAIGIGYWAINGGYKNGTV